MLSCAVAKETCRIQAKSQFITLIYQSKYLIGSSQFCNFMLQFRILLFQSLYFLFQSLDHMF